MPVERDSRAIERAVVAHYGAAGFEEKILGALRAGGADLDALRLEDLALVDELHIGRRQATEALFAQVGLKPGMCLLDIGSGLGGTARYVAATFECHVTGIDLTQEFVDVAASLSRRVGLSDRVTFRQASALALPFPDGSFDGAYTLHVAMNVADKAALYREAHRVLRPGAIFAIYDVLLGATAGGPHYPVPWASDPSTSFLASLAELSEVLGAAGFEIMATRDRRLFGIEYFEQMAASAAAAPPGTPLLMGADFAQKVANLTRSMKEERVVPTEFICRRMAVVRS